MLNKFKEIQEEIKKIQENLAQLTQKKKQNFFQELTKIQINLQQSRNKLFHEFKGKKIIVDSKVKKIHKKLKINLFKYIFTANLRHLLSAPLIYGMIVPLCFFDFCLEIYHNICFPLYGIKKIKRSDYLVIDRHKLAYLNLLQKLNCIYCGYGNGLMAYAKEIVAKTEQYWCPIKHSKEIPDPHNYYNDFFEYTDGEGFIKRKKK